MLTWSKLYSLDSLLIAATQNYTKCLFQKYKAYTQDAFGDTLFDWARHNKANLIRLHNQLQDQTFTFQPFNKKVVEMRSKVRNIFVPTWRDRVVDGMLNVELNRHTDKFQSKNSYAYRLKNAGVDVCQTNIARQIFQYDKPVFIVKRDISNYYPSINKGLLLDIVTRYVDKDDYLFHLIRSRVNFLALERGIRMADEPGIPFGSPLSCFLANLFLCDLDRLIEKYDVHYFRYADDIIFFSPNREAVVGALAEFNAEIARLGLSCKPSHTKELVFNGDTDEVFTKTASIKHLGLCFRDTKIIGIAREKQRKILNIFKRVIKKRMGGILRLKTPVARARMMIGLIDKALTENIRPTAVIDYYLKHMTDERQLQTIDKMVAELILSVATGRGYKKSNFKILSFGQLRDMGLPSLLHRHRLLNHGHIESNFFDFRTRKKSWTDVKSMRESAATETI